MACSRLKRLFFNMEFLHFDRTLTQEADTFAYFKADSGTNTS
jgi:hypothetical protein